MTFKVGITGDIASGKSTLSAYLRGLGFRVIDADEISRAITKDHSPVLGEINAVFPGVVSEGILDRKQLGRIVFDDPREREKLNAILHPPIREEIRRELEMPGNVVFLDAPLLYEGGYAQLLDIVLYLAIDEDLQLERLMSRDGLTKQEALKRMSAFDVPREEKIARSYVIDNSGSLEELLGQADVFLAAFDLLPEKD